MRVDLLAGCAPLSEREALMVSPLRLAFVGDAVHDLFVRTRLLFSGGNVRAMHREAVGAVNAGAQAQALSRVFLLLTETEGDVVKRGRNAHAHHGIPKRTDPADYSHATGLEALLGFLYLTGQTERLQLVFDAMNGEGGV
jgi:ribonuclease-3 family protein